MNVLTQPGGGTATIPPGSVAKLIPPKYIDSQGNLVLPKDLPVPDALRELIKGPPPNLSVQSDGTVAVYGADIKVSVDGNGHLAANGKIDFFGFGSKDLTPSLNHALKPVNAALDKKGLKVIDVTLDPASGITIKTGPK